MAPIGIIGGSGLYAIDAFKLDREVRLSTPFGEPSDAYRVGTLNDVPVVFLPRHGVGHLISPSELNFRANIWGMKKLGVTSILSVSAVGSLKEEIHPGHMVVIDQFIDRTTQRVSTFFEKGMVAHVSFANPVCDRLRETLIKSTRQANGIVHERGTYICMEGPMFSSRAESRWYRSMGADVIGMTNIQEAKLAREAGLCYATLALSTDYDCWHEGHDHVTTADVIAVLQKNIALSQKILLNAVAIYKDDPECVCHHALKNAILTDRSKISEEAQERLALILGDIL